MDRNEFSDWVLIVMKNLNLMIVLYIALVIAYSLNGHILENSAMEFLSGVSAVPMRAWKIPVLAVCLTVSVLVLMRIETVSGPGLLLKVILEIAVSLLVSYLLGFSYTGMILLILADTMRHFPKSGWQYAFALLESFFYLVVEFDLFSLYVDIVPLNSYLSYYQSDVRFLLQGLRNVLTSLNMFAFLIYMIVLLNAQMSEKKRIMLLNEQLHESNEKLQMMTEQLLQYAKETEKMTQIRERNRLAREIHDTLGHSLTGIITGIEACVILMDEAPEATKVQLTAIADIARQGITDVRRSVKALRPDALEKLDLESAINRTIDEMKRATKVEIDYRCSAALDCFNNDEEDVIYRIVQESITNSIRHGKAGHIWISIDREYNLLMIDIRDDGCGCAEVHKGFGLNHMEERVRMLNGKLEYGGTDGFTVKAQIPIRWGKGEDGND